MEKTRGNMEFSTQVKEIRPTPTYITKSAVAFWAAALIAIVCMFTNWFPLNMAFFDLEELVGSVSAFTLPGLLEELKDSVGIFGRLLPDEVQRNFAVAQSMSYVLVIAQIAAIGLYGYAAYLRFRGDEKAALMGRTASGLALLGAVGFLLLVIIAFSEIDGLSDGIVSTVTGSPWIVTVLGAVVTMICSGVDVEYREDTIIFYDGSMVVDRGPKWKCSRCGKKNLSMLTRCYQCGEER